MYKMNPISAFLAKIFVTGTKYFGLINLVLNDRVVPEFFQNEAHVDRLTLELLKFLNDTKLRTDTMLKLGYSHQLLGQKGATVRVAEILNSYCFKI